jgi:hypothetical protein
LSTTCAHACCFTYCIYTTRALLRRTFWGLSWWIRRVLGVHSFSQWPVVDDYVYLSAVSYLVCYFKNFRSCNKVIILPLRFWHCFLYTESTHVCNLILAHMCFMHSDLSLNPGVIVLYGQSALCVVHRVGLVFLQAPVLIHGRCWQTVSRRGTYPLCCSDCLW